MKLNFAPMQSPGRIVHYTATHEQYRYLITEIAGAYKLRINGENYGWWGTYQIAVAAAERHANG